MLLGQDFVKPYDPYIILNQFFELFSDIGSISKEKLPEKFVISGF